MDHFQNALSKMKAPGDHRPGIWRGGVLQIKVTNMCDLDCKNCSVGVGLAKKLKRTYWMKPEDYRAALQSLKGYTGVVGMFGGNPCIHPKFDELCAILREEFPDKDQRGLWSNKLFGKGKTCRETFSPVHSNLNVHQVKEAYDEMKRDWPEARVLESGLAKPSMHGPLFGSPLDLGISEEEMWDYTGKCYVNQTWSAEITSINGELRGYFCEIAATQADLTGDPSGGMPIVPGWWKRPIIDFADQVRTSCSRCLVALNGSKIDGASNEPEGYTASWAPIMMTIKNRPLKELTRSDVLDAPDAGLPATMYLDKSVMRKNHK